MIKKLKIKNYKTEKNNGLTITRFVPISAFFAHIRLHQLWEMCLHQIITAMKMSIYLKWLKLPQRTPFHMWQGS